MHAKEAKYILLKKIILNKLVPIHIALIKFNHSLGPVIEGIITFECAKGKNYKQSCHVSL
jgi:hypothetical protein